MKMTDAELDYCNAEGIPPAEYAKRKANRVRNSKRKARRMKIDETLAEIIRDQKNSDKDLAALGRKFAEWSEVLSIYLKQKSL